VSDTAVDLLDTNPLGEPAEVVLERVERPRLLGEHRVVLGEHPPAVTLVDQLEGVLDAEIRGTWRREIL